ncbi:type I DNA topoisomerase [Pleomorphochaeta sp. DL1XJH-081]|uniref:type I DNA topoisomerase n=1 Tax=Pleomorphochaeta sp. DL1XJH-081 TaxID=3409690 RepID=UPI003BB56502
MANKQNTDGKTLIVVESPTKARTIKKFLPEHCTVIACNGHVRDLPVDDMSIDVENGYTPKYVVAKGKDKIIKSIKSELATSSELLLATDEDREGESISWHLLELLKPKVPYRRMVFHEITKRAITHAMEHGRKLDMDLVNAQEARRILDRLFGYSISPVLWKKLSQRKLSAGRVQSPGLRMVVERERQRLKFKTASYWDIKANLHREDEDSSQQFEAKLESISGRRIANGKDFLAETGELAPHKKVLLLDEGMAKDLVSRLQDKSWQVLSVEEKEKKQRPAPPFITSTLQQEGSRKLRLSAKDTMRIAQKLYESGLITYMRTDSPSLSQEGIKGARDAAGSLYGLDYLSPSPRQYATKSSSAQEAHEAIRPAGEVFVHPDKSGLHGLERALYELIWKRTLASQMAEAIKASTSVKIGVDDAQFSATGNRIVFPGFIRVYVEGKDDPEAALEDSERLLPHLVVGNLLQALAIEPVGHETKPPARYTEATLVQELEKQGIGRPSTYATIIDKLFEKSYVEKDGSALVPTFIGFAVVQFLENHFTHFVDYAFTSKMEDLLDGIAENKVDQLDFLKTFYEGDEGLKVQIDRKMKAVSPSEAKNIALPHISDSYQVLIGKFGPYIAMKDDDGENTASVSIPQHIYPGTISEEDIKQLLELKMNGSDEPKPICEDPKTKLPIYLLTGRFGPYFQLGMKSEDNPKPKRLGVPKGRDAAEMTCDEILKYLSLPRELGKHPESKKPVIAHLGPYGPYVGCDKVFRSLSTQEEIFSVTLEEALALLAAPKPAKGARGGAKNGSSQEPVVSFGEHEGKPLGVFTGRYGFYGKIGDLNFQLPKEMKQNEEALKELTKETMIELSKSAKPPKRAKKGKAKK